MHPLLTYLCILSRDATRFAGSILLPVGCATASSACFDDPYGHTGGGLVQADAGDGVLAPGDRGIGTLLFLETTFLDHPQFGTGPLLLFGPMLPKDEFDARWTWEEAEGSPFACKVVDRTPDVYYARGLDMGTVNIDIDLGAPEIPPCKLVSDEIGWACNGASGSGGDIHVVDAEQGIISLTDPSQTFDDEEVGRVIKIEGASNAANDGEFMVVAAAGDTLQLKNPAGVEEVGTTAEYITYAGRGPAGAEPRISDMAEATVSTTKTGDSDFRWDDFSNEKIQFGNEFKLDTATEALLTNFPMDGNEITVGCNGEGGDCGRATASSVDIETTDAPFDPDLPSLGIDMGLPPPINHSVQVLCIFLTGKVVIPKEASEYIANSGATRVRTMFLRGEANSIIQPNATTTLVAGHAVGGFTDLQ